MTQDPAHIWTRVQAELRHSVGEDTYELWLAPLALEEVVGGRLVVGAPPETRAWVAERFGRVLAAAADAVLGAQAEGVDVRVARDAATPAPPSARRGKEPAPAPAPGPPVEEPRLNPKFTFEQFVIGDANRFAHAAALAVAELPGQAYNPLFIYGPPGVGKTHLLHSIGNYVMAYGAGMTVRYTTIERFTNEFISALHHNQIDRFKGRYRRNDVLLIDDVQFLESKVKTEEEFFHTFNALLETGSQLVLTSDRLPSDMTALEDRMRERFEAGLLTDIQAPDLATRLTVLRKRAHHDGIPLAEEGVLELLAERVTSSVRNLEGALIRVVAYASLRDEPLTADLARHVLDRLRGPERRGRFDRPALTVEQIQEVVGEAFSVSREELLSPNRTARVAWPRQVAMFLAREHTAESLPAIAARFGGRDHTTVMHACKRVSSRMASDPEAYEAIRALTARLAPIDADRSG